MEQLEVKHRNDRGALSKVQERDLDQVKQMYERDTDKLRQNHKTDLDKRVCTCSHKERSVIIMWNWLLSLPPLPSLPPPLSLPLSFIPLSPLSLFLQLKQENSEDRKFQRSLKDRQDQDMKQFVSQQKGDYRASKVIFKKVNNLHATLCMYVYVFRMLLLSLYRKLTRSVSHYHPHSGRNYMKSVKTNCANNRRATKKIILKC